MAESGIARTPKTGKNVAFPEPKFHFFHAKNKWLGLTFLKRKMFFCSPRSGRMKKRNLVEIGRDQKIGDVTYPTVGFAEIRRMVDFASVLNFESLKSGNFL